MRIRYNKATVMVAIAAIAPIGAWAGGLPTSVIDEVIVTGRLERLQGNPDSATQGVVSEEQLGLRPVLRAGELMETVPGLIVTQHSGDGKANQFFLRGFNLDHGTDLATSVDGVPVNMPTHSAFTFTAQGYEGDWRATDQIPLRAVASGQIERFGYIDPTNRGDTHRFSLSADWRHTVGTGTTTGRLYAIDYDLNLFSNFTYFTDRVNGDQFEQVDQRRVYGGDWSWRTPFDLRGLEHAFTAGVQVRRDDIENVGLYRTIAQERFETIREDAVRQTSYAGHVSLDTRFGQYVRTSLGARFDHFAFDVDSSLNANSGQTSDSIASPKLSIILGPWHETELFANVGRGFHSNDARGTTITVDPADGVTPVERVDPLVAATGIDVGLRTAIVPTTQLSISLWQLELDSELLFIGDAGTTEASRKSERRGLELSAIWNPLAWLIVDTDLAWSRSRFEDYDPAGDRIPGAVENVASVGISIDHPSGWFGGARFRHFGAAPLVEDNSVRSDSTTLVNLEAGLRFARRYKLSLAMYNVFDSEDADITYFYESQLPSETTPVEDIHFHPVEPRTVRLTLSGTF